MAGVEGGRVNLPKLLLTVAGGLPEHSQSRKHFLSLSWPSSPPFASQVAPLRPRD